uniref:Uncharacterized protein n=1 Tax=Chenopodium quinoa TaxID=63459 RepID=A0A803LM39_CHEQI
MGSSRSTAEKEEEDDQREINGGGSSSSSDPSRLQLDLLPLSPVPRSIQPPPPLRFPWLTDNWATTSKGSDDEENGSTRKKLRLSKEQSAFLEESFKEHHTLNPEELSEMDRVLVLYRIIYTN